MGFCITWTKGKRGKPFEMRATEQSKVRSYTWKEFSPVEIAGLPISKGFTKKHCKIYFLFFNFINFFGLLHYTPSNFTVILVYVGLCRGFTV